MQGARPSPTFMDAVVEKRLVEKMIDAISASQKAMPEIQTLTNDVGLFHKARTLPPLFIDKLPAGCSPVDRSSDCMFDFPMQATTLNNMTKRKRTLTDDAPDNLPERSSETGVDLTSVRDSGVLDVLPGITRKITACGACRKQKVRCEHCPARLFPG